MMKKVTVGILVVGIAFILSASSSFAKKAKYEESDQPIILLRI